MNPTVPTRPGRVPSTPAPRPASSCRNGSGPAPHPCAREHGRGHQRTPAGPDSNRRDETHGPTPTAATRTSSPPPAPQPGRSSPARNRPPPRRQADGSGAPSPPPTPPADGVGHRLHSGAPSTRPPAHDARRPTAATPAVRCDAACAAPPDPLQPDVDRRLSPIQHRTRPHHRLTGRRHRRRQPLTDRAAMRIEPLRQLADRYTGIEPACPTDLLEQLHPRPLLHQPTVHGGHAIEVDPLSRVGPNQTSTTRSRWGQNR